MTEDCEISNSVEVAWEEITDWREKWRSTNAALHLNNARRTGCSWSRPHEKIIAYQTKEHMKNGCEKQLLIWGDRKSASSSQSRRNHVTVWEPEHPDLQFFEGFRRSPVLFYSIMKDECALLRENRSVELVGRQTTRYKWNKNEKWTESKSWRRIGTGFQSGGALTSAARITPQIFRCMSSE